MSDTKTDTKKLDTTAALPPQRTESRQSIQSAPPASVLGSSEPATEEVAALAYQLWIERGSPHGSHEEDWLKAEEQLRGAPLSSKASA